MSEGPVNYVEKGAGLHEAVAASGHFLRAEYDENGNEVWIGGGPNGPEFVQGIIDTYQAPVIPRWFSSAKFIRRLPEDRWDAINQARLSDMKLQRLKDMLITGDDANPGSINLDSAELAQGLDYVMALGLITPEQKSALLE